MFGGTSPQYHFCKILIEPSTALAQGGPCALLPALLNTTAQMCRWVACNTAGERLQGAYATASHLIAHSPPAMSPNVTHEEPRPQGLSDSGLAACPIPVFWTERQKGLLKAFTPGADFAGSSLRLTYFETINRLHFLRERLAASLPGSTLERHEGREGF